MKRIPLIILLLSLCGYANAGAAKHIQQLPAQNADAGNVTRALEQVLDRGDAVKVEVECISTYDGMSAGYRPEDYGCEDDNDAIVESEKFLLREVLGKYARFSIGDGSTPAAVPAAAPAPATLPAADSGNGADPAAGGSAVEVSSGAPAAGLLFDTDGGVTHRIVIEVRNHFSRESGMTICHYNEKRQLQGVRDDSVLASDRFIDSKSVEYRPSSRREVTIGGGESKPFSLEKGNSPFVSRMKEREVMTDQGPQKYYSVESEVPGVATSASRTPETTASTRSGIVRSSSRPGTARPISAAQLVRILRQRSQNLHDMSDQEVLDRFSELCPEAKDRIVVAEPEQ